MTRWRYAGLVLAVLGLLATAVSVAYFTVPANALPAMLGRLRGVTTHRERWGQVTGVLAIVLLVSATLTIVATNFPRRVTSSWHKLIGS